MTQATIINMDTQQEFQDWECLCGYVNEGIDEHCLRCSSERHAAVAELNRQREEELIAAQRAKLEELRREAEQAAAREQTAAGQTGSSLGLEFHGNPREFLGPFLLIMLLSFITFGIYSSWATVRIMQWIAGNSTLQGRALRFSGTGLDVLLLYLIQGSLVSITLGIYSPWAIANIVNWFKGKLEYAG